MKDIMSVKGLAFQTYRSISQICTESSQFIRQDEIELLSRLSGDENTGFMRALASLAHGKT